MSEMNTASPRIPSPLDTAGMMAVASAPGLAGQGTAQRGLAGGGGTGRKGPQAALRSRAGRGGGRAGRHNKGTSMSWLNDKGTGQGRSHRQEMWV